MKKLAFVFPGQGSQSLGMLQELAQVFPMVEQTFAEASAILGYDLWQITKSGPEEKLNQTDITQPALLTASAAIYQLWLEQNGPVPVMMAGHSLGEYSALVCAGIIEFAAGVDLVAKRGRYMIEAMQQQEGSMAAIVGLEDEQVAAICVEAAQGEVLAPANYNSIGQIVIAGHKTAIKRAIELATTAGARLAVEIAVSVPCHCSLMQPAANQLAKALEATIIQEAKMPIIHNVDVTSYQHPQVIRDALIRQLYSPVRWVETIQLMAKQGITHIIECGPGKVLTGLIKRIDRNITTIAVNDSESLQKALLMMQI